MNQSASILAGLSVIALLLMPRSGLISQIEQFEGRTIKSISVEGNENMSREDILDLIQMRQGARLSGDLANGDLKTLFNSGSFAYIAFHADSSGEGVDIKIIVQERSRVEEIEFRGLDELNRQEITEAIPLKENEVFTERKLSESVSILIRKYREKGLFNAVVKTKTVNIEGPENLIKVIFIVDEGENIKISKINLIGIRSLDPEDILAVLELEEEGFISDGTFKEAVFEKDKETIIEFYRSRGYLDAELEEARWDIRWSNPVEQEERVIVVNYKVREGEQYFYGGYDVTWDEKFLHPE
ncbi:MAG: outer membrane protein assembly factor, partial [Leptospiraceae bacterium]|nr:outer membrane protein assembly factor [Leptospiraceae bacterium]